MSHVAAVQLAVKDLGSLREACKALDLEFLEHQTSFRWYGRWVNDYSAEDAAYHHGIDPKDYGKCSHAIRLKGDTDGYEIGVVRRADGSFSLVYDFYGPGGRIASKLGNGLEKLKCEYARCTTIAQARRQGFQVSEQRLADGSIKLVARR